MVVALLLQTAFSYAQTGINSPYSMYGIGTLSDRSNGMMRSMGGIGTGFRQRNIINLKNPASYSTVDTLTFLADAGFSLLNGNFEENGARVNARNAAVDYLAMQFRVQPKIGMTLAFLPFSKVGYNFSSESLVRRDSDGEIMSTGVTYGEGGLRQFMAGLGWRPAEWLSVGADVSYIKGDLTRQFSTSFSSGSVTSRTRTYTADFSSAMYDFGIQGTIKSGKDRLVIGATYSPATDFNSDCTIADVHTVADTASIEDAFHLPDRLSVGLSYSSRNWTAGADVSLEKWSDARFFGESYGRDRFAVQAGLSLIPEPDSKKLFRRTSYQAGLKFSQPYYNIGDNPGPLEFGATAGFSLPVTSAYNSMAYIHVSGQYSRVQPQFDGSVCENYIGLSIGVTFMERWFMKWMVE